MLVCAVTICGVTQICLIVSGYEGFLVLVSLFNDGYPKHVKQLLEEK